MTALRADATVRALPRPAAEPEPNLSASVTRRCAAEPSLPCDLKRLGAFMDRSSLLGSVTVERCRRCGVGVSSPFIPDVASLYADRTSQDFQPDTNGLSRLIKQVAFRRQAKQLLSQVPGRPAELIDFGCGSGLFTRCLAERLGRSARVYGVDFHPDPPAELGDVGYRASADVADLEATADLLLAMHVLEHDDDSHALLERMLRLVRSGGHVALEVPNVDCVWGAIFGRFWDGWYLPYHRIHFSRAALRALLADAGLEIVRDIDVSVPTMGRTVANLLGLRNGPAFILLGAALHPIQWALEVLTGRATALRVIARKP